MIRICILELSRYRVCTFIMHLHGCPPLLLYYKSSKIKIPRYRPTHKVTSQHNNSRSDLKSSSYYNYPSAQRWYIHQDDQTIATCNSCSSLCYGVWCSRFAYNYNIVWESRSCSAILLLILFANYKETLHGCIYFYCCYAEMSIRARLEALEEALLNERKIIG